jgi:hypothetical protein
MGQGENGVVSGKMKRSPEMAKHTGIQKSVNFTQDQRGNGSNHRKSRTPDAAIRIQWGEKVRKSTMLKDATKGTKTRSMGNTDNVSNQAWWTEK